MLKSKRRRKGNSYPGKDRKFHGLLAREIHLKELRRKGVGQGKKGKK